jgi:hypothetical protein
MKQQGHNAHHAKNAAKQPAKLGLRTWSTSRKTLVFFSLVTALVMAKPMGLLLWARLRILTSIPKTAIADDPANIAAAAQPPQELDPRLPGADAGLIDPFSIDPHTYPTSDNPTSSRASIVPSQKSDTNPTEVHAPEAFEAARRAAERFRLQSAGRGLSMAVIDGRTYRIGDALESADGIRFVLLEVLDSSAVLGHGEERIEIRMRGASTGTAPSGGNGSR